MSSLFNLIDNHWFITNNFNRLIRFEAIKNVAAVWQQFSSRFLLSFRFCRLLISNWNAFGHWSRSPLWFRARSGYWPPFLVRFLAGQSPDEFWPKDPQRWPVTGDLRFLISPDTNRHQTPLDYIARALHRALLIKLKHVFPLTLSRSYVSY